MKNFTAVWFALIAISAGTLRAQDPAEVVHFIDKPGFTSGDEGFAVPIGETDEGTIFAAFSQRKLIEREPLARFNRLDTETGWAALPGTEIEDADLWPAGHVPKLAIYPVKGLRLVPLFIDEINAGTIADARLEGHETVTYRDGGHFPVVTWERAPLQTGQFGALRVDETTAEGNYGDSSLPRFVRLPDGRLALLGLEVFRKGGAANWTVWRRLLQRIPGARWEEVRWTDRPEPPEPAMPDPEEVTRRVRVLWEASGREW